MRNLAECNFTATIILLTFLCIHLRKDFVTVVWEFHMVLLCYIIFCLCFFRAIVAHKGKVIPLSRDFTPESERQRLQLLVRMASCTVLVTFRQVKVTGCKLVFVVPFII